MAAWSEWAYVCNKLPFSKLWALHTSSSLPVFGLWVWHSQALIRWWSSPHWALTEATSIFIYSLQKNPWQRRIDFGSIDLIWSHLWTVSAELLQCCAEWAALIWLFKVIFSNSQLCDTLQMRCWKLLHFPTLKSLSLLQMSYCYYDTQYLRSSV